MSVIFYLKKIINVSLCLVLILYCFTAEIGFAETGNQPIFTSASWPPVIYRNEEGKMSGLYADILHKVLEERMGLSFQYKQYPWKRAQQEVKEGLADFFIAIPNTERLQYAVASKRPFLKLYLHVYTYKNHPQLQKIEQIETVDDIKNLGLTTVSNMGNGWQKANIDAAGIPTFYALTEQEACLFLARKRADIMLDAVVPTNHVIKNLGISGDLVLTRVRFGPINLHLLISKRSKYLSLMDSIDMTFAELEAEGIVDSLLEKYNSLP